MSSGTPERVLVVGATGALGRPVVLRLRALGWSVRALSRHAPQAVDLAASGAECVAGDLTDRASIERALDGCTRVLAAAHAILGRGRWRSEAVDDAGHRALLDAARAAGVRRFVYVSALGAGAAHPVDFFRTKARVEQLVRDSGLDAVVLRPAAFMEQHVHAFNGAQVLAGGTARLIGAGSKPRNFVSAADVAEFAVRALVQDPAPYRVLDIGGPDHASNAEVAALYARLAGRPLRVSHLPAGVARALAALLRPLHPGVARILGLLALPDDAYPERFDGAVALQQVHGVRLTRLEDFVRAQVAPAQQAPAEPAA